MKFYHLFLLLVTIHPALASAKKKILVTYFEPFQGRVDNASESIAKSIETILRDNPDAEVVLCKLPVVYGESIAEAKKCFDSEKPKPDYMISLGEMHPGECHTDLTTQAHNLSGDGWADNKGNKVWNKRIIPGGAVALSTTFPMDKILCSMNPVDQQKLRYSTSAGSFICNEVSYGVSHYLRGNSPRTRYQFVHVPNSGCPNEDIQSSSSAISNYLAKSIELDRKISNDPEGQRCPLSFPTTSKEFDEAIETSMESVKQLCRTNVFKTLKESLKNTRRELDSFYLKEDVRRPIFRKSVDKLSNAIAPN